MKKLLSTATIAAAALLCGCDGEKKQETPLVVIINYGQIPPLLATIDGIKKELQKCGYVESRNVRYEISDIAFDHSLIPQTVASAKNHRPTVMVLTGTPIMQFAKGKIHDIPLVYNAVTDPVDAKLIDVRTKSAHNITGSSDMQNLNALLTFIRSILPNAKTIGLPYAISDSNDTALINMMRREAESLEMSVVAVPVDQVRDIPVRIQELKGKADFIYVSASGLQSALPVIASEARKMNIPVFNIEEQSVRDGLALASFGVNYESVGRNAGKLVARLLKGDSIKDLSPIFPNIEDHRCFVNKKLAEKFGIQIPKNATIVE
ncbi:MAG: ABC transporter substrate-binding protein [Holosporaceae bacterium]|jgi:putative ABC transport system substrate-binding protein|nr:ABC transporter substrate-binding protein [Holosporaceae bacterium]